MEMKKLPFAEFEVMRVLWANEPPVTTNMIMDQLGNEKNWKVQAPIVLLNRLIERGFVRTEKNSKERTYFPLVDKETYLQFETKEFVEKFHGNSFSSLITALYNGEKPDDKIFDDLLEWVKDNK